jgi:hypothetical protein
MGWTTRDGLAALGLGVALVAACNTGDKVGPATSDAAPGASACVAAGGQCTGSSCSAISLAVDCGSAGGLCCLDALNARTCEGGVPSIQASNYDQSCEVDSDCVGAGVGDPCVSICEIYCRANAAISKSSLAQFTADVARISSELKGEVCGCPENAPPCCVAGSCAVVCPTQVTVSDAGNSTNDGDEPCALLPDLPTQALLYLTCEPNDLTTVDVSGPCASSDASFVTMPLENGVYVASPSPGVCHVALTFGNGFMYSTDITFTAQVRVNCGTTAPYVGPTQTVFYVDNPSTTCGTGGADAAVIVDVGGE